MKRSPDDITHVGMRIAILALGLICLVASTGRCQNQDTGSSLILASSRLRLEWRKENSGWKLYSVQRKSGTRWADIGTADGEVRILYSDKKALPAEVTANKAGTEFKAIATSAFKDTNRVLFNYESEVGSINAEWTLDPRFPDDIRVDLKLTTAKAGYYCLVSPTLVSLPKDQLAFGMIPGYWQGTKSQPDPDLAFKYGQGLPETPVLAREKTATTLCAILSSTGNLKSTTARTANDAFNPNSNGDPFAVAQVSAVGPWSIATIVEPGMGRVPWVGTKNNHTENLVALSLMDREGRWSPTLYSPLLDTENAFLPNHRACNLIFRYSITPGDWKTPYRHTVEDIYRLPDFLKLKQTRRSLTSRLKLIQRYVTDDQRSLWRTDTINGLKIGAQSYLGGVKGATKGEAVKNSDIGAMWMLSRITGDKKLNETRLPFVRNFKLAQQQTEPGFFQGAAIGQYWLLQQHKFVEEWGPYVEPMALTYYSLIDDGNILLFQPDDKELRERVKLGAETLLRWQKEDGSWDVAFDRESHKLSYPNLKDLRPTWYGLLVAYRTLGDRRYLEGAIKGADWFLKHAVEPANFLGVCGDADFVMDFATGQSAQCLLDLYAITKEFRYREAAIRTAEIFWTWTYTHPIPNKNMVIVNTLNREEWEISQTGLSMEHGGTHGSANTMGPILLCSHAGMFVRMYSLTGEKLFLTMARAAALGRDAFVDEETGVASYYWKAMNAGAGPYPHHAWWQVGWIMDYLLAEAELRSGGKISFPRGFVTPKVGAQQCAGFSPGTIYGTKANLWMPAELITSDNPYLDTLGMLSEDSKTLYVVVLSEHSDQLSANLKIDPAYMRPSGNATPGKPRTLLGYAVPVKASNTSKLEWKLEMPAYGIAVIAIPTEL